MVTLEWRVIKGDLYGHMVPVRQLHGNVTYPCYSLYFTGYELLPGIPHIPGKGRATSGAGTKDFRRHDSRSGRGL